MPNNSYPDLSNDKFDIKYAQRKILSSDLLRAAIGTNIITTRFNEVIAEDDDGEKTNPPIGIDTVLAVNELLTGARQINLNGNDLSITDGVDLVFRFQENGGLVAGQYGAGMFLDGGPEYLLGVDADGNIVEVNPAGLGMSYSFQHSLTESGSIVNLVNDQSTPGNSKYYGTNSSGTKGWYDLPESGSTDTNFAANNLTATGNRTHSFDAYTSEITYNTLAGASGFKLSSTSTLAVSSAQKLMEISLSGANANSTQTTYGLYVTNSHTGTTATNIAVYGTVNNGIAGGTAVYGAAQGGQIGVRGTSSSGYGVYATSSSSTGLYAETTSGNLAALLISNPSSTNTVVSQLRLLRTTSGTAANGIGAALDFYVEDTAGGANGQLTNQFISKWTDATNATRTSQFELWGINNAVGGRKLAIAGSGALTLDGYGAGTLTTDASGNVTATSDINLKHVLDFYATGIDALMRIQTIRYKWNERSGFDQKNEYIGFSAQNIGTALGDLATGKDPNGFLTIQDRAIMATLVNAVQEQQKQIQELKQRLYEKD